MKVFRLSPFLRHVALREWFLLSLFLVLLGGVLGWQNGVGRGDQTIYDNLLSFITRPARDDIIIIDIDDYSLAQLGRWPWPRKYHAELLDRLTKAQARSVGLDVIFSEPERPQADGSRPGDQLLAQAIANNHHVVLPVELSDNGAGLAISPPIPEFAQAASALGHINLQYDEDGVVRSVYLNEGQKNIVWPHFALALLQASGLRPSSSLPVAVQQAPPSWIANWRRFDQMRIPYGGNNGHFQSVPYVAVLRGEVPDAFFTNKIVLIGATAQGMADAYPTPVSSNVGAMPGVEINANILDCLLDHKSIVIGQPWQTALFSIVPVLLAMLGYLWLSPRMALVVMFGLFVMTVLASFTFLNLGIWFAPRAALIALILSYPLWSWRRLDAVIMYLGQEFIRLEQEPHLLPEAAGDESATYVEPIDDLLERRITAMKNATRRVRDLRQFVSDSLNNLPDVTLITRTDGHVLLANKHANTYFASFGFPTLIGVSLFDLVTKLVKPEPIDQIGAGPFIWQQLIDLDFVNTHANGIGASDAQEHDLLVKSAPCYSANNALIGWSISIIDISTIRAVERSRDETLRFLSHDMRAPQASILALLELQSEPSSSLPGDEFFSRIEKAARKTLGLADNFVQLARAESYEYRLEEVDFQDVLQDAIDELWTQANSKHIKIVADITADEYPTRVDRGLITRAVVNLLSNAIHYSPAHTCITCVLRMQATEKQIVCQIIDQGCGIAKADMHRIFRRFQRLEGHGQPRHDGIGLGLVFVKTVIERHHGTISFVSTEQVGTTFTVILPGYLI